MDDDGLISIDDAMGLKTRELTNLPPLPAETPEGDSFIGGDELDGVVDDGELTKEQKQDKVRGTLSNNGEAYDPLIHAWPPSQTKPGAWKKRRKRRGASVDDPSSNANFRKEAENMALLFANFNYIVLGEGAEVDERVLPMVTSAIEQKYREDGITEVPSWVNIALSMSNYTFTVATKPKPKERLKGWTTKVLGWFRRDKEKESMFPHLNEEGDAGAHSNRGE